MTSFEPGTVVRTVSEFTSGLARWFAKQEAFKGAAISGEISGLKEINGGHLTFLLKDRGAGLNCIAWRSTIPRLPALQNGAAIIAVGDVELRQEYGSYQMVVDAAHLTGIGELYAKLSALKEKLRLEGLFEPSRKRAIPQYVRRVALISAEGSKASEDFLSTIAAQVPFVKVVPLWTRVQGSGAEIDIREAFDRAERTDVDLIVLTRGGGSYEDLFTFNEEVVVRAIARSRHPVITAIGHQTDHHLADDVADATYGTPSKAAEAVAAPWIATRERLVSANRNLRRAVLHALGRSAQRLELVRSQLEGGTYLRFGNAERALSSLERRLNAHNPAAQLSVRAQRLSGVRERLPAAWQRYFSERRSRLQSAIGNLALLDPEQPLARGYALIFHDGSLVRSARDVAPGDGIVARLGHGTLDARVEAVRDE
jgi:exodeoxyribonuclease VII large subunit